jgi:predicted lipoprotein with Yx(FWY)xxD motif
MRKSGWGAATGLGSLVLLLAACGGSSSSSSAASGGTGTTSSSTGTAPPSNSGQAVTSAPASSSHQASAGSAGGNKHTPTPHNTAGPQPSSGNVTFPPQGTTVMIIQHSNLGFVLAMANGQVVYTYAKDAKGGSPKCTGQCATQWPPVTGTPKAGPADHFPGTFSVVRRSDGREQITYDGMPLYKYQGAKPLTTVGNKIGGVWHVVPMSASYIG